MYPDSPYAHPIGSFQSPVSPPTEDPDTGDLVQICVNRQYIPLITGALTQLLLQSTWDTIDPAVLGLAQQRANQLIFMVGAFYCGQKPQYKTIGGTDEGFPMIRQNPDNPCELQSSVDGVTWCTWADLSKCMNFGTQPGNVDNPPSPVPGGGSQLYCVTLQADQQTLLPVQVSDGDQIYLIGAVGAGWDGVETNTSLPVWRCVDGEVFFAGACVGGSRTSGSDPLPAYNHMQIIAQAGVDFFPLVSGGAMLVGGQSNVPLWVQVNDVTLPGNQGSYTVCVKVVNNAATSWSHTLDFRVNNYGFSLTHAVYTPGVGFTPDTSYNLGVVEVAHAINATIHDLSWVLNEAASPDPASAANAEDLPSGFQFTAVAPIVGTGNLTYSYLGSHATTNLQLAAVDTAASVTLTIVKLTISGTGPDPFPGAP